MSARCRTALSRRWTCRWPDRANKLSAVRGAQTRGFCAPGVLVCRSAVLHCPSEGQETFASYGLSNGRPLTSGPFGVPSCRRRIAALRRSVTMCEPDEGTMLDTELRTMVDEVKDGRVDRRAFIQR